jgi:hypothetical protein
MGKDIVIPDNIKSVEHTLPKKTKFDKIKHYVFRGKEDKLPALLKAKYEQYEFANMELLSGKSPEKVVNLVAEKYNLSKSHSYLVVRECRSLFADVYGFTKASTRVLIVNRLFSIAEKCIDEGDTVNEMEAYKLISQITGLKYQEIATADKENDKMPHLVVVNNVNTNTPSTDVPYINES